MNYILFVRKSRWNAVQYPQKGKEERSKIGDLINWIHGWAGNKLSRLSLQSNWNIGKNYKMLELQ